MALDDDIDFLDRIPTFHVLGREALRILAISAETVHLRSGELLFEEGEPADAGYVVREGAVVLKSADERAMGGNAVARRGTLIGETALVVDCYRPATATALEPSALLRIPRGVFLRMLEGEPAAAVALRKMLANRLKTTLDELDMVAPLFGAAEASPSPDWG